MAEYDLSFSPSSSTEEGSFKLLELPPDLYSLIENAINARLPLSLAIKGQPAEDAVLCTDDKTFAMRSVDLSNTVLIVSPPPDEAEDAFSENAVVIRDQVNEILELTPAVPKLHKLGLLLKGREYDEGQEEADAENETRQKLLYADARDDIQASDAEFDRGLKDRRILNVNGELRPITPAYLSQILELTLNLLVSLSLPHHAAPTEELCSTLADEQDVPRAVSMQVMSWFGEVRDGKWAMDVKAVVKEVGLGVLRHHKDDPIEKDLLLAKWKSLVGDTFELSVELSLLSGNYLVSTSSMDGQETLTYFPASSLPVDPAARFGDLFLTRSRWKVDDITPFLADISLNSKERDKLLLKFARNTTDSEGLWYTARATYNG